MLKRWLMALPMLVLLSAALMSAWALVRAQIWQSQTRDFLDYWVAEGKKDSDFAVTKEDWLLTLAGANNALEGMPASPELQVMRARVLDRGVANGWSLDDNGQALELAAWQQAVLSRPGWPYSWYDYAAARSQRSLIDPAFESALLRADQLGPWEQTVLVGVAGLGRYYQRWLSAAANERMKASFDRLKKQYPRQAQQLEKQYPTPAA